MRDDGTKRPHRVAAGEKLYLAGCGRDYERSSQECWRRPLPWRYIPHLHRTTGSGRKDKDMCHRLTWLVLDLLYQQSQERADSFLLTAKVGEVCWRCVCPCVYLQWVLLRVLWPQRLAVVGEVDHGEGHCGRHCSHQHGLHHLQTRAMNIPATHKHKGL